MKTFRVRQSDDSMRRAGIQRGDVVHAAPGSMPKQRGLCVAFTAIGHLVVRRYYREPNGYIRLTRSDGRRPRRIKVYAPGAVYIFGAVSRVEKGGRG
jgi:SOS-response transcriptional repressor LexA